MRCALAFLLMLLAAPAALCAEDGAPAVPAGRACSVPADGHWTRQEQWVWQRVCLGEEANFNLEADYGGDLDPKAPAGLPESRILRSSFLATILLADTYRRALTARGVRITGARFTERVDLQNAELSSELWLDRSLLEKGANLQGLTSTRRLTLYGSKVAGPLNMAQLDIRGDLSLGGGAELAAVDLSLARIGGFLVLSGSTVTGDLNMAGLQVGGYVMMNERASFAAVDLTAARVGGLSLAGSRVTGLLNMAELQADADLSMYQAEFADIVLGLAHVHGNLVLANSKVTGSLTAYGLHVDGGLQALKAEFADASLADAEVGGAINLIAARVTDDLDMTGLRVGRALVLSSISAKTMASALPQSLKGSLEALGLKVDGESSTVLKASFGAVKLPFAEVRGTVSLIADFAGPVVCTFAKLGALDLTGGNFQQDMDLTGTQIDGELQLGVASQQPTTWGKDSTLHLRNARADAIQDVPNAWPPHLDLSGFAYRNLGGIGGGQKDAMANRPVSWFVSWLAEEYPYAPAPYEQLASVLRSGGRPGDADDVLYAGRERERAKAGWLRWAWLSTLDLLIGYGYHVELALVWIAGFIAAGIAVLRVSGEGRRNGMPFGVAYSFDMLLPIIRLRDRHYQIDLVGWPRYYFYLHKIMGYVLASFLIAGLAGLTK